MGTQSWWRRCSRCGASVLASILTALASLARPTGHAGQAPCWAPCGPSVELSAPVLLGAAAAGRATAALLDGQCKPFLGEGAHVAAAPGSPAALHMLVYKLHTTLVHLFSEEHLGALLGVTCIPRQRLEE